MRGGIRTQAACMKSVLDEQRRGLFASKLPPRDVEAEAMRAWRAVDMLSTADSDALRDNMQALLEMRERIELMIERTGK